MADRWFLKKTDERKIGLKRFSDTADYLHRLQRVTADLKKARMAIDLWNLKYRCPNVRQGLFDSFQPTVRRHRLSRLRNHSLFRHVPLSPPPLNSPLTPLPAVCSLVFHWPCEVVPPQQSPLRLVAANQTSHKSTCELHPCYRCVLPRPGVDRHVHNMPCSHLSAC